MKIDTAYTAHLGGRDEQQDAVAVLERPDGSACLVVLADGMGGHAGGSLASRTVVEAAERIWKDDGAPGEPRALLARIVQAAHDAINQAGEEQNLSPRSTCVLLLLRDGMAHWAHIGDSRLYRFRDGAPLGRTRDHSVVQMLLDMGKISEEEMGTHPDQNRLTQSLGGDTDPEPDFGSDEARDGDGFILCSDGLWEMVKPEEMAGALAATGLDDQPDRLASTAFDRAGRQSDNISIALVRVGGPAAALAASEAPTRLATTTATTGAATAGAATSAAAAPRRKSGGGAKFALAFVFVGVLAVAAAAAVVRPWEDGAPFSADRPEPTAVPKDETRVPAPKSDDRRKLRPMPDPQPKEEIAPKPAPRKDARRRPEPGPDSVPPGQAHPRTLPPKSAPDGSTEAPRTAPETEQPPPPDTAPRTAPRTSPRATPKPGPSAPPETRPQTETDPVPPAKPDSSDATPPRRSETAPRENTTPELVRPGGRDDRSRFRDPPEQRRDQE